MTCLYYTLIAPPVGICIVTISLCSHKGHKLWPLLQYCQFCAPPPPPPPRFLHCLDFAREVDMQSIKYCRIAVTLTLAVAEFSVYLQTVFYMSVGCISYAAFGNHSPGNLLTGKATPLASAVTLYTVYSNSSVIAHSLSDLHTGSCTRSLCSLAQIVYPNIIVLLPSPWAFHIPQDLDTSTPIGS